jgi:hypothetical protein
MELVPLCFAEPRFAWGKYTSPFVAGPLKLKTNGHEGFMCLNYYAVMVRTLKYTQLAR